MSNAMKGGGVDIRIDRKKNYRERSFMKSRKKIDNRTKICEAPLLID